MKLRYILLIAFTAIIAGIFIYFKLRKTKDFEPLIKLKFASMVSDASNGLYTLDIGHISIDIAAGSINATDIMLKPDTIRMAELERMGLLGNTVYTISLARLNLEGLTPIDLINDKSISLNQLVLDSPDVKINYKKRVEKRDTGNLYGRIASKGQAYNIGSLLLNDIRLTITNEQKNKQVSAFKNLSASFKDIKIDSSTVNDSTRFLYARDAVIFMKGYSATSAKKRYNFTIDSIALRPQNGSMELFDLKLRPVGSREQFSAKLQYMEDQYDIQVKEGTIKNMKWFSLLSEEGLFGEEMYIKGGHINIFDDRRLPPAPSKAGHYPHQLLMKVNIPVYLGKVSIDDMNIKYEEFNPKSSKTGMVEFSKVGGTVENVTNIPERIATNHLLKVDASVKLMNDGPLNAKLNFDLGNVDNGDFEVMVTLGKMDGKKLNPTTEGLGLIKINDLVIDKLEAHVKGNNTVANGKVKFAYKNLSVDILKADDEGNLKKRGLLTFIAKNFLLKASNPSKQGEQVKDYTVTFTRDPEKSFINLIWKTILEGLKKSVRGK